MSILHQQRAFYGLLTLAILTSVGYGLVSHGAEGMAFGFFSSFTIAGSLMCIWERSVVRSAFSLMATFMGVAGLFLLLGSDFLAMAQILIYVGGILALILFGVMLTPPDLGERSLPRIGGTLVLVLGGASLVWKHVMDATESLAVLPVEELTPMTSQDQSVGLAFLHPEQYVVAFELAAFLLTVALVAAVYIARRRTADFEPEEAA
ncbi:MAG: NADH-quinone oxidoreductase subunit J [Planctomycetota bacterium]|mgnify:CR=1 FL=1|jgi:NADH-quinone oxidoreductase subunit J|nr:NADH-quinone oxidoreductase subunit J [Planctomycetota bacterium]